MASRGRAVMDRELLERFVPVFILSQTKVIKLKKLEMLRSQGVTIQFIKLRAKAVLQFI